ncbi:hypothetical protein BGW36DRAFT_427065 [Talaromyces proteolyticus]|uniref:Uncharacterized protein n=1 Tax=Talaromyces proteolyticus TaxID=1131652 RepID=A0AAD4KRZ3_9EURO|nr:uncharacterized protein BGW36DRAFT_427065 [Talaromyces proteolyticus]KAH8697092.1 hypothetical protein BGW36DRAFT_427065 [Talaromyces proteolyticus]
MAWGRLSHVVTVFSVITFTVTLITLVFTYLNWRRRKQADRLREDIVDFREFVLKLEPYVRPMPDYFIMDESERLLNNTLPLLTLLPESSSSSSHSDIVDSDRSEGTLSWLWRLLSWGNLGQAGEPSARSSPFYAGPVISSLRVKLR